MAAVTKQDGCVQEACHSCTIKPVALLAALDGFKAKEGSHKAWEARTESHPKRTIKAPAMSSEMSVEYTPTNPNWAPAGLSRGPNKLKAVRICRAMRAQISWLEKVIQRV